MEIQTTDFPGLLLLTPRRFGDHRGYFMESWSKKTFEGLGLHFDFIQDNHARSKVRGVLRGLHFQKPPFSQTKLVRVTRGEVYDVVVDLRQGSPTFGKWAGFHLSEDNCRQLLVPKGFAHAYMTLSDDVEFLYKVDAPYAPDHDSGLRFDDPELAIDWPVSDPVLSDKDKVLPLFREVRDLFTFEDA